MNTHASIAVPVVSLMLGTSDPGQAQSRDQLGQVDFQNSCSSAVQESFQRSSWAESIATNERSAQAARQDNP